MLELCAKDLYFGRLRLEKSAKSEFYWKYYLEVPIRIKLFGEVVKGVIPGRSFTKMES